MGAMKVVLLVEDTRVDELLMTAVLNRHGYWVAAALGVDEARHCLSFLRPDLILTDLRLGQGDGIGLVAELQRKPATASIPVVAVTASAMPGDREAAISAGCVGYLTKPINTRSFVDQVESLIRQAHATDLEPV
jgi:CheY-like chemotaxis protein